MDGTIAVWNSKGVFQRKFKYLRLIISFCFHTFTEHTTNDFVVLELIQIEFMRCWGLKSLCGVVQQIEK